MISDPGEQKTGMWRDGVFLRFYGASLLGFAATQISRVILPILIFEMTGSALSTASVYMLQMLPYIFFGLLAGAIADRVDRRRIMLLANLARALTLTLIPLSAAFDLLSPPLVYTCAFIAGIAWVWADAANFGAVPMIVGRPSIVAATSVLNSSWMLAGIVGLPVGGVLVATIGAENAITISAAGFALAGVGFSFIGRSLRSPAIEDRQGNPIARIAGDVNQGVRYVRRHRIIGPLTLLGFGSMVTSGAVTGLLVVYGVDQLQLLPDDYRHGWLYATGAAGGLIAVILLPALARRFSQAYIAIIGYAINALFLFGVGLTDNLYLALFLLFVWDGTLSLTISNGVALRQRLSPDHLQSRVSATGRLAAAIGVPIGAGTAGTIADIAGIQTAVLSMAAGAGILALIAWWSPLGRTGKAEIKRLEDEAAETRS